MLMILAGRNAPTGQSGLEWTLLVTAAKGEECQPDLNLPKGRILQRNTVAVGSEFGIAEG